MGRNQEPKCKKRTEQEKKATEKRQHNENGRDIKTSRIKRENKTISGMRDKKKRDQNIK